MTFFRLALTLFLAAAPAATALAQERQWTLDAGDSDAYLVFGVPETDDVGVSFWCTIRTNEVQIMLAEADPHLKVGRMAPITVTAGKTTVTLSGKVSDNEEGATTSIEASMPATSKLFPALLAADRFKVHVGKQNYVFPLGDADLTGLLDLCRKP